jgi:hypothetical protein
VKEQDYTQPPFEEIFAESRFLMSRHRTIVFYGYGWGNKGINQRLMQWLRNAAEKRIVILYGGEDLDRLRCNPFWTSRWQQFVSTGKLLLHTKWLKDCSPEELLNYFR